METIIVYSLIVIFFLLLTLFVTLVLLKHPYSEPPVVTPKMPTDTKSTRTGNKVAYGLLALLFTSFFVLALLDARKHSNGS